MLNTIKRLLNKYKDKSKNKYIEIFESKYGMGDLSVYATETGIESIPYHYELSVEGYIWYNTLKDGVDYYNKLLLEFENFIVSNVDITDEDLEYSKYQQTTYKRFYGVDIRKDDNGWTIYSESPTFYNLNDTYLWFKGLITQLNEMVELT